MEPTFRGKRLSELDEFTKDFAVEYLIDEWTPREYDSRPPQMYEQFLLYDKLDEPRREKIRKALGL